MERHIGDIPFRVSLSDKVVAPYLESLVGIHLTINYISVNQ